MSSTASGLGKSGRVMSCWTPAADAQDTADLGSAHKVVHGVNHRHLPTQSLDQTSHVTGTADTRNTEQDEITSQTRCLRCGRQCYHVASARVLTATFERESLPPAAMTGLQDRLLQADHPQPAHCALRVLGRRDNGGRLVVHPRGLAGRTVAGLPPAERQGRVSSPAPGDHVRAAARLPGVRRQRCSLAGAGVAQAKAQVEAVARGCDPACRFPFTARAGACPATRVLASRRSHAIPGSSEARSTTTPTRPAARAARSGSGTTRTVVTHARGMLAAPRVIVS